MVEVKIKGSKTDEYPIIVNDVNTKLVTKAEEYTEIVDTTKMDSSYINGESKMDISGKQVSKEDSLMRSHQWKKLVILDINGLLADIISPPPKDRKSDINILRRAVFKRPFLDDFLGFCFQRFDVAIWSSRTRKILEPVVDYLLGDLKKKLLFIWDLSHCTNSSARCLENRHKLIVFKDLRKIWDQDGLVSENRCYDESNTLLLDDSPYKALLNPKHTGIFPLSYSYMDINDKSLGPDGDLRVYLEGVAASENVKMYLQEHPFGQGAIDETSPHWAFYLRALETVYNNTIQKRLL